MTQLKDKLELKVGDRVTYHIGSDSYAQTVSEFVGKAVMKTRGDRNRQIGDYHSDQRWISVSDPNGYVSTYTLRPDGTWRPKGSRSGYIARGSHQHQDPSF